MEKRTRLDNKALIRSLAHIGLQTSDLKQAHLFYVEILELDLIEASESDFTVDLCGIPLIVTAGGRPGGRSGFALNFKVRDFDRAYEKLTRAGVGFISERNEVLPGIWAAAFLDPDGNRVEIMTPIEELVTAD
ncbi:MAG: VOC family protein [Planctomycetes bacterium]|jgi:catechol 2,3-dioxygenase-like lactoylglutathione lyase family enzyme|nr:VOC family protein [Planctomycetota bacterium]